MTAQHVRPDGQLGRRTVIAASLIGLLHSCSGDRATTPRPADATPEGFLAAAEEQRRAAVAQGDQSFGAVIVLDERIVGFGPSRVVTARDPTAHAEMEAIRDAARRLKTADLSGSVLYSTSKPCAMCESAAYWARVAGLVSVGSTDAHPPRLGGG